MSKSELKEVNQTGTGPNILLLMSGSIACAKASSLISEWSKRGHKVRVACTQSVSEFIGASSLQRLGAEMVFDNVFASGQAMEHISLGRWDMSAHGSVGALFAGENHVIPGRQESVVCFGTLGLRWRPCRWPCRPPRRCPPWPPGSGPARPRWG